MRMQVRAQQREKTAGGAARLLRQGTEVMDTRVLHAQYVPPVAPPVYSNLTGLFGLATVDPAWEALAQPGVEAGLSLVTNGYAKAHEMDERAFADAEGYRVHVKGGGEGTFELQDSDVVCLQSADADADGYHSLVQVGDSSYKLPPQATVTLVKVEEPGQWEALGHSVRRRLYTVSVTYK